MSDDEPAQPGQAMPGPDEISPTRPQRSSDVIRELVQADTSGFAAVASTLNEALWLRDAASAAHCQRVANDALRLCDVLRLDRQERTTIGLGALLHDLGKIGIPDAILLKPAALSGREWSEMRAHPVYGRRILESFAGAEAVARLVYHHHERLDGQGYPQGLKGPELTRGMRIVTLCDAADSMLSEHPFRSALRPDQAVAELYANAGTQFDPDLVHLLVAMLAPDLVRRQRDVG